MPASEPALRETVLLVRCAACGSAATVGVAADLHASGAYQPGAPRGAALAAPLLRAFDRGRLALLRAALPPPARLLDAGAGRGRFVAAARAAGYDACGIEPSPRASAAHVEPVAIEDAPFAAGSFDAVTLWHVAEHLDDPGAALARIGRWLRPGGVLLLGVPNLGSLQARIGGPRWYHLDVPRHRVHFTVAGARALLARSGFAVESEHHLLLEHNPFGLWQSAVSRVTPTPSWLYNALKRNVAPPLRAARRAADGAGAAAGPGRRRGGGGGGARLSRRHDRPAGDLAQPLVAGDGGMPGVGGPLWLHAIAAGRGPRAWRRMAAARTRSLVPIDAIRSFIARTSAAASGKPWFHGSSSAR